jgi:hypothetical protein
MKYIKRFNENFNKIDSIDMKNIKVVFDFYSNQDVIPRKIYITSKDEIKLGDGFKNYMMMGCFRNMLL